MPIRQRYLIYFLLAASAMAAAMYVFHLESIQGIAVAISLLAAIILGYLTLAIFVSLLTKNPKKTFRRFFDIFDFFLLWP